MRGFPADVFLLAPPASGASGLVRPGYAPPMVEMMMILVLFSGPDQAAAERIAQSLAEAGGKRVHVVIGPAAAKELDARGVKDVDLVNSPDIGAQLTRKSSDLVVVRIEQRKSGGDGVLESTIWVHGRTDHHVSIAGKKGDPVDGTVKGVLGIVGPWLPDDAGAVASSDAKLAQLVDTNDWQGLYDIVSVAKPQSARYGYYEVLALMHLSRSTDARATLERMRTAHPGHFLVDAAAALIDPEKIDKVEDSIPEMGPPLPPGIDDGVFR